MTRAESQANLAYPEDIIDASPLAAYPNWIDRNLPFREGFVKGYEQAEKDTIERAIAWLKENANKYIVDLTPTYPDATANIIVGGMCWEHLKDYLQNE